MDHQLRPAEPADMDQLIQLCAAHAAYEQSDYDPVGKSERLSGLLFAPNPNLHCRVVVQKGKLLGYMAFARQVSTWDAGYYVYMDCLYLKPEARGLGLGQMMMDEIKRYAQSENCHEIQWQTPAFNEGAIRFYKRNGAVAKSKERFFLNIEGTDNITV